MNSTPISTVRMQRSLLAHDMDDLKKNWDDEKEFLENENKQLRIDLEAQVAQHIILFFNMFFLF